MINQRYIVKKKLGEGRSKVYCVIDSEFPEKEIAIKILSPDVPQEEKNAFRQEYFTLKKLDHPNLIKAYDLGMVLTTDDNDEEIETGSLFITLERFDSVELLDYPSLAEAYKIVGIVKQICSVLFYLHQSNYIYYDLKPQNILVSSVKDQPVIKIIDLGFARYILSEYDQSIRGTAEYIAPELLKKESHDHSIDLYSLGIILYRIIYDRFPFSAKSELEIYKAHVESNFEFPETVYSNQLLDVVKKLLNKDPEERYTSSLQVLVDLGIELDVQMVKDFLPARVLSSRKDVLNIVKTYLNDNKSNEIFTLRGFSGAGKTEVLSELNATYTNSVYIENTRRKTGLELVRYFLHKLLFSDSIFNNLMPDDQESIKNFFDNTDIEVSDSLKALLTRVTENKKLLLLIDDFNLYDDFSKETINELFPILQINKIKVIIAETSEFQYTTDKLFNIQHIQITPFTDRQLSEYLDLAYYSAFPRHKLRKVILNYSDLLPGSIVQFIKDILVLGIMRYEKDDVKFVYDGDIEESLRGSNEQIYRLRLSNLSENELKVSQMISAFNISVEQIVLSSILNKSTKDIEEILKNLQYKNIIHPLSLSNSPNIISDSFKRYIYSTINEKKKYHLIIASLIKRVLPEFNTIELARQYRLGGDISRVIELTNKEIQQAETLSAYSYKRKLLEDLLTMDVNEDIRVTLECELVRTLFKQSDFSEALRKYELINFDLVDEPSKKELTFIKGSSLIAIREIEKGIKTLQELLEMNLDPITKEKILVEIAYAKFEQNHYKEAEELAVEVLQHNETSDEDKGKCFNLLGMIKVYADDDLHSAIEHFNKALDMYKRAQLPRRVAGVEVNLGNIYDMIGDDLHAEMHWNNALAINTSIGNLEQEAAILINVGVFFLHKLNFEKAVQQLTRSDKIFSAIGKRINQGLVQINLGEVYLISCNYQNSFKCFAEAVNIFKQVENVAELANSLFNLAKLSYFIGDLDLIQKNIEEYENCISNKEIAQKFIINHSVMKIIYGLMSGTSVNWEILVNKLNEYLKIDERRNFIELTILFLIHTFKSNGFNPVTILDFLFSEVMLQEIQNNYLLNASREYFLGRLSKIHKDSRLLPSTEHFEKALSLIEDEDVTEITWRILYSLSENYAERGFINKAKKPLIYAAELLNYIAENINIPAMRSLYLNDSERQKVFQMLQKFNIPTYVQ